MAGGCLDDLVGLAADPGRRGQDVASAGQEVQVVIGQVAIALTGPGEVDRQPAGRGADVRGGAVCQPGLPEVAERGEAVTAVAMLVDVEDIGSGRAGRDREVAVGVPGEPASDLAFVGAGVEEAAAGGGDLLARLAGENGPAAARPGQRVPQHRVVAGHGMFLAWPPPLRGARTWLLRL